MFSLLMDVYNYTTSFEMEVVFFLLIKEVNENGLKINVGIRN